MLAKDASEKDISESRQRLKERQSQRRLDLEMKQAIDIVNEHCKRIKKSNAKKEENK